MRRGKRFIKSTACLTSLILAGGVVAGCGGNTPQTGTGGTQNSGPLKVSMMMIYYTTEPPKDEPILKKVKEHLNVDFEMTWVPTTAYDDKVNAAIAAGELPQVVIVNPRNAAVIQAADSGMFWDISPYIKDLPNISKLHPQGFKNSSINGKIYGVYRSRPLARDGGVTIRKDWLDKLGLKEPTTVDELYNVYKAFTNNDPDGNGKNDTYGFSSSGPGPAGFTSAMTWFGGPNGWGEKDGKLQPDFMFPQFMEVMKWYKKMYSEKLFNQDFAAVKDSTIQINQGKAGVYLGVLDDVIARFTDLYKSNPNAYLDVIGKIEGPGGHKIPAGSGYNNMFAFPKTSVKTEADLKKILAALDKLGDKQIQDLFEWGVEGVHSKIENGKRKLIDVKKYNDEVRTPFFQFRYDDGALAEKGEMPPVHEKFLRLMKENEDPKISVHNPTTPLISKTNNEKGSELRKIIDDARVKFIMGQMDEAEFNKAVDTWRKQGGDKIIEEYTAQNKK